MWVIVYKDECNGVDGHGKAEKKQDKKIPKWVRNTRFAMYGGGEKTTCLQNGLGRSI